MWPFKPSCDHKVRNFSLLNSQKNSLKGTKFPEIVRIKACLRFLSLFGNIVNPKSFPFPTTSLLRSDFMCYKKRASGYTRDPRPRPGWRSGARCDNTLLPDEPHSGILVADGGTIFHSNIFSIKGKKVDNLF